MIKLVFCLRRREGMTREEFQDYWLNTHGPLVRRHAQATGCRRYVQVHTTPTPLDDLISASRGAPEPYDGVAELWWDSVESLVAAASTPEGQAAARELLEDERTFIDHGRSPVWLAVEHQLIG